MKVFHRRHICNKVEIARKKYNIMKYIAFKQYIKSAYDNAKTVKWYKTVKRYVGAASKLVWLHLERLCARTGAMGCERVVIFLEHLYRNGKGPSTYPCTGQYARKKTILEQFISADCLQGGFQVNYTYLLNRESVEAGDTIPTVQGRRICSHSNELFMWIIS